MAKTGKIRTVGSTDGGIILNEDNTEIPFVHPFIGNLEVAAGYNVNFEATTDEAGKPLAIEVRPIRIGVVSKLYSPIKKFTIAHGMITDEITKTSYDFRTYIDTEDTKIKEGVRVRYEVVQNRAGSIFATHLSMQRAKNFAPPVLESAPADGGQPEPSR